MIESRNFTKELIMGYIDPNLFGILSQIGLAILLVLGVVVTFFRSFVKRLFGFTKKKNNGEEINDTSTESE
jgi:hypothetical protein